MDDEQLSFGTVACDAVSVTLGHSWETGWHGTVAWRRSGSGEFDHVRFSGRDAAETLALLSDQLSELLGATEPPF